MAFNISATVATDINYAASHQKKQIVVKDIRVLDCAPGNYVIRIVSEPAFLFEFKRAVSATSASTTISIVTPEITFNDALYRTDLIEAQDGRIRIEIYDPEKPDVILGFLHTKVHIQPYLHWDALHFPDTLPAFMQPNDPLLNQVMKRAGEYASEAGDSMCGYQCRTKTGVRRQADYIYQALQDMDIHYLSAPASFDIGQKIRIPHQVLHESSRQGTCLDLAVLYASALEADSLNSLLVLVPGHAFAAVWLVDKVFPKRIVRATDYSSTEWSAIMQDILPIECTTYTDGKDIGFEDAVAIGKRNMAKLENMTDVERSRRSGENPVYTYTDEPICEAPGDKPAAEFLREEFSEEKRSRIAQLRDKSMDLTVKSRLLSCDSDTLSITAETDASVFLRADSIGDREEAADEIALAFMDLIGKKTTGRKSAGAKGKDRKEIFRELYSRQVQNERETGKSNLYIAINELIWKPAADKNCHAVMYLCPAEIYKNRRGDYQLRVKAEGLLFNPALKVLLNQSYQFDTSQILDRPGAEYDRQLRYIEFLIENQKGWQIKQNIVRLALYNVPNEAVWNGLSEPSVASHEIVAGLLEGQMNWVNRVSTSNRGGGKNGSDKDKGTEIYAFETDSSQREIIESAFERKAQVVVGPAGDGKTQTVVNIMAEAVRRGEKVLFVSEKAPAMEVAYEKLNEIFDGLFNLRILSGKDKPADIIRQIKKTLDYLETHSKGADPQDMKEEREKYRASLAYLEKYYSCMTEKTSCGKSMEELINMYEKYSDCDLRFKMDDRILGISLSDAEEKLAMYGLVLEECDQASGKYTEFIRYDNLAGKGERETLEIAQAAIHKYRSLLSETDQLAKTLGAETGGAAKEVLEQMLISATILADCPVLGSSIEDMRSSALDEENEYYDLLEEELEALAGSPSFLGIKNRQKRKCYDLLRERFSIEDANQILKEFEEDPEAVLGKVRNGDKLSENELIPDEEKDGIRAYERFMKDSEKGLRQLSPALRTEVKRGIEDITSGIGEKLAREARAVLSKYREYAEIQKKADRKIVKNLNGFREKHPDVPRTELYEEWIETRNYDSNKSRILYDSVVADLREDGYGSFIEQVEEISKNSKVSRDDIMNGFFKCWAEAQIDKRRDELVKKDEFNYLLFKSKIMQLVDKEKLIRENVKEEIRQIQFKRVPNLSEGVSGDAQFGILQKLVRRKKTTVRAFFKEAPTTLHTLFPCMIMDPTAVAEYIPSGFPPFDLVLIDEGSQMPLYNALIPISHAGRCMIFGDEKQLQPIDTFKIRGDEEEEDFVSGRDSILTAAYISSMPRKMLRFHYRSENESLIAFSNEHYYNGDIVTFPSADTRVSGVSYTLVEDGFYDRKKKVNQKEAEEVIERIREIYEKRENEGRTLGVITLNIHQRNLIQSLLMKEIREDSKLGKKTDELVTVVNLESCQGKEWDYVILSPGFGNDQDGKFYMGFGALNQEYGANRLNVMLTRARRQMMVITSIEPHMLTGARSEGVRDFREFLKYAQGEVVLDKRIRDKKQRATGLVNAIARALEEQGYEVHTNIGSSDFKVDLGIVDRENPGSYALGILIDHFNDAKSSIHDREVIYPGILASKGWKTYRLCGLNWMNDPRREIMQIQKAMEVQ